MKDRADWIRTHDPLNTIRVFEDCVDDLQMRHELTVEETPCRTRRIHRRVRLTALGLTINEEFVKQYLVAESVR